MKIEKVVVGDLLENCYIVSKDDYCLVIDPGDEFDKIDKVIGNKKVLAVLITHHHFDHVGALDDIVNKYNVSVLDFNSLEEKEYIVGPFTFHVIYNPGHTKDSVSYYFKDEKVIYVGDFIFKNSIGRCDLAGGNFFEMENSLDKIKKYPDDIIIYPGHGDSTTLGYEKKNNSFFR